MSVEAATLVVDLAILFLLIVWMVLDRTNIYFKDGPK